MVKSCIERATRGVGTQKKSEKAEEGRILHCTKFGDRPVPGRGFKLLVGAMGMLLSREFSVLASLSFAVAPRDQRTHAERLFGHPTRAKTRAHRQFWRKPLAHFRNRASSSSTPAHTSSLSSQNHHSLPSHRQLSKLHIILIHSFKSRGRFGPPPLTPSRWKPFHKTDSFPSFCKAYSPRSTSEQPITLTSNLHSYSLLVSPTPRRQCL